MRIGENQSSMRHPQTPVETGWVRRAPRVSLPDPGQVRRAAAGRDRRGPRTARSSLWLLAEQQAKLLAQDGASHDYYGYSVAFDDNTAIIGAYRDDDNGPDSGSVCVFTRTGDVWNQQAKLLPSDGAAFGTFGNSVVLEFADVLRPPSLGTTDCRRTNLLVSAGDLDSRTRGVAP